MLWGTLLVVGALVSGVFDVCTDLINARGGGGESTFDSEALPDWSSARSDFAANPDPPVEGSGLLGTVYGGSGTFFGFDSDRSNQTFAVLNFEFWEGSPAGWVEYVDEASVVDCETGEPLTLPGAAFLKVHFEAATRKDDFIPNSVAGGVILDARETCDRDGILEWVIALQGANSFKVDVSRQTEDPFVYSVVSVEVLN